MLVQRMRRAYVNKSDAVLGHSILINFESFSISKLKVVNIISKLKYWQYFVHISQETRNLTRNQ